MNNLFIIGENFTGRKYKYLNINTNTINKRTFSTTKSLRFGGDITQSHVRPVLEAAEFAANESVKKIVEETSGLITPERAALYTESTSIWKAVPWGTEWLDSHGVEVALIAGTVTLIILGFPAIKRALEDLRVGTQSNENETNDALREILNGACEKTLKYYPSSSTSQNYPYFHYLNNEKVNNLIRDIETLNKKLKAISHQLEIYKNSSPNTDRSNIIYSHNVTLNDTLISLEKSLYDLQKNYLNIMENTETSDILAEFEVYDAYYDNCVELIDTTKEFHDILYSFLNYYEWFVDGILDMNLYQIADQFINSI